MSSAVDSISHNSYPTFISHEDNQVHHRMVQIVEVFLCIFPLVYVPITRFLQLQAVFLRINSVVLARYVVVSINHTVIETPVEQVDTSDSEDYYHNSTYSHYVKDLPE